MAWKHNSWLRKAVSACALVGAKMHVNSRDFLVVFFHYRNDLPVVSEFVVSSGAKSTPEVIRSNESSFMRSGP